MYWWGIPTRALLALAICAISVWPQPQELCAASLQADGGSKKSSGTKAKSKAPRKTSPTAAPTATPKEAAKTAPKADPKEVESRLAKLDVEVVFPSGAPSLSHTVERVRTGRGKWWREPEAPPPDEPITAQAIKVELRTPLELVVAVTDTGDIVYFGVAGADPPLKRSAAPEGLVGAEVSLTKYQTFNTQFTAEVRDAGSGRSPDPTDVAGSQALARLLVNALGRTKLNIVYRDGTVATVSVGAKGADFVLKFEGAATVAECSTLTSATRASLERQASRYERFQKLKPLASPLSVPVACKPSWNCTLAGEAVRESVVFEGCVHCARRPANVIPSNVRSDCPGCQHNPLCEGRNPEGCAGCRKGLETKHYMTSEEAQVYRRLQDQAAAQAEGSGSFVEIHIRMPCIHQSKQRVTRKVTERRWALGGEISLALPGTKVAKCIMRADPSDSWAVFVRPRTASNGDCTLVATFTVDESIPDGKPRAGSKDPSPDSLASSAGLPQTPQDLLERVSFLIEDSDGSRYRARYDRRGDCLRAELPSFAEWELLEEASGLGP
jgi:hypothetical protein